jgi:hypothetical protein
MMIRPEQSQEKSTAPEPTARPLFWRFCRDRDLSMTSVARIFGRSRGWAYLICLPFDDPRRRVPDPEDVAAIHEWSGGVIGPPHWYPPELTVVEPTPEAAQ